MLNALLLVTALGFPQGDVTVAAQQGPSVDRSAPAGAVILVKGGPDRRDPFAELKEKRRQEAERRKKASQDRSNQGEATPGETTQTQSN